MPKRGKIGKFLKNINVAGSNNELLKFLNFVAVSDSDSSYIKEEWKKRAKKYRTLYILIILFVTIIPFFPLVLPIEEQNKWTSSAIFSILNVIILIILLIDYALRWVTYPFRASKFSYFPLFFFPLSGVSILMIFSLLPTLISVFAALIPQNNPFVEFIKVFSVMRIIRLLMLLNVVPTFKIFTQIFEKNKVLLINVFFFVFIMAIIFALLFYSVEGGIKVIYLESPISKDVIDTLYPDGINVIINNALVTITSENFSDLPTSWLNEKGELILYDVAINEKIRNLWDCIYFTFITITTIGYGDIYPVTTMGRLVVIIDGVLGIVIFSLPSGIITGSFIVEVQEMYKNRNYTNQEKEINRMSFFEKIYYKATVKTKKIIQKNNENDALNEIILEVKGINNKSEFFEKLMSHIDDDNIIKITNQSKSLKIELKDVRAVSKDFYTLCNLLNLEVKAIDKVDDKTKKVDETEQIGIDDKNNDNEITNE